MCTRVQDLAVAAAGAPDVEVVLQPVLASMAKFQELQAAMMEGQQKMLRQLESMSAGWEQHDGRIKVLERSLGEMNARLEKVVNATRHLQYFSGGLDAKVPEG